jgi:hypothetical protein
MKRLDILDSIEDVDAEEQREAIGTAIDYMESKFLEIRDLLECVDLESLDNIIDAKNIAEDVSKDLY